jgi:hypothetical protein
LPQSKAIGIARQKLDKKLRMMRFAAKFGGVEPGLDTARKLKRSGFFAKDMIY